jgi:hypothetical protein
MKKAKKKTKKGRGTKKSKHTSKPRRGRIGTTPLPITVCSSGTISHTDQAISFVNSDSAACTITSCNLPGWPSGLQPVVPAEQNGILGEVIIPLTTTPTPGTYQYTSDCCPNAGPPDIVVQ